jgi:hypothetical protein
MKNKILVGNAYKDRNKRHWLVGSFMNTNDLKNDKRIEVSPTIWCWSLYLGFLLSKIQKCLSRNRRYKNYPFLE